MTHITESQLAMLDFVIAKKKVDENYVAGLSPGYALLLEEELSLCTATLAEIAEALEAGALPPLEHSGTSEAERAGKRLTLDYLLKLRTRVVNGPAHETERS